MNQRLQLLLVCITLAALVFVISNVRKGTMKVHYSIIWIVGIVGLLLVSIFPKVIYWISSTAGIEKPVNTVFLIMIFISLVLIFYLYSLVSKQSYQILRLTYKVADLERRLNDKEKEDRV